MSLNQSFSNVKLEPRIRRAKYISNSIKGMISSGELKIGDRLPTEENLCKHFQVSRTTLREAIQMLRARGMLHVAPGRGSFIKEMDISDLTEDLALFSRSLSTVESETTSMVTQLLLHEISQTSNLEIPKRQSLFKYVIDRGDSHTEAETKNRQWKVELANLNNNKMAGLIVDMLLRTRLPERQQRFTNPDEVMRTIQSQVNLNTALVDGDTSAAKSIFSTYMANSI